MRVTERDKSGHSGLRIDLSLSEASALERALMDCKYPQLDDEQILSILLVKVQEAMEKS